MEHLSVEVLAEATITVLVEATMTVLLEATTTVLGQLPGGKTPPPPNPEANHKDNSSKINYALDEVINHHIFTG